MSVYVKGQPEFLEPGSDEHRQIITPSKVAAIVGLSRWTSAYKLWHEMRGLIPPDPNKDAFDIGHDMEPYAAARWTRRNPDWRISTREMQYHVPAGHFPFPAVATIDRLCSRGRWRRNLEVKIARDLGDLERFGDDLTGDAPEDYAVQCIAQRLFCAAAQPSVTWLPESHLFVIGPYFNERLYPIEYDPGVATWIIESCVEFYESLSAETPPPLDDSVATYECLRAQHPDIDAGSVANLDPGVAINYLDAQAQNKHTEKELQGAKNALLAAMGRAQTAIVGTVKVADRRNNGKGGVSLYAARGATPDLIHHMAGDAA